MTCRHVASHDDVLRVLTVMRSDLAGAGATGWGNPTLDRFLEAFSGFRILRRTRRAGTGPLKLVIARYPVAATGYE